MTATWDEGALGLTKVVEMLLKEVECTSDSTVVDLGSGSGQLSIPLAKRSKIVYAVDISPLALEQLEINAKEQEADNIEPVLSSIEEVMFEPYTIDCVVSNYTLHHLLDSDKRRVAEAMFMWLKPGGEIIIGDMMFGRGTSARDREIIKSKVSRLIKRGPGGWIRIIKNIFRYSLRFGERPVPIETWVKILSDAGFQDISFKPVVAEAVVMKAVKPRQPSPLSP